MIRLINSLSWTLLFWGLDYGRFGHHHPRCRCRKQDVRSGDLCPLDPDLCRHNGDHRIGFWWNEQNWPQITMSGSNNFMNSTHSNNITAQHFEHVCFSRWLKKYSEASIIGQSVLAVVRCQLSAWHLSWSNIWTSWNSIGHLIGQ